MNQEKQSCESCKYFERWKGYAIGECNWNKPMPAHYRRYGSGMRFDVENSDFGEDCPAWEKKDE